MASPWRVAVHRQMATGTEQVVSHDAGAGGEFDEATRDTLHEMLAYAGHDVVAATMDPASLTCLAAYPDRLVVLCSNKHADHHLSASFFAHVAVDARLATQHQYILLSSNPATIPRPWRHI